ncbi:MAG: ABC transporter permease, partial [Gemmatimonadales bacterium]|nr:ABC transporter permease [Gemmatimonadales bacterium]
MNKVVTIIRKEYLERVRSKSFLIGTILGPALMSLFILLPILLADSGAEDQRTIGVVDLSGQHFEKLNNILEDRDGSRVNLLLINSEDRSPEVCVRELKELILEESIHSGMVIPAEFIDSPQLSFYNKSVSSMVTRDEVLRPVMNQLLREIRFAAKQVPDSLFTYLAARTDWTSISVDAEGGEEEQDETVSFAMAFILIMIIYIMVIMYGSHTLTAVIEEKSSRMVEVMLSSVSPGNLMLGKVLGIGFAGLTQFGIWTLAFFFLSQQGVSVGEFTLDVGFLTPIILISFIVFFLLGFFLYATLYAGFGAMCNTVQDSQQFHTPLAMGLVIPMMLLSLILRAPDSTISVVLSLVPLFSPVLMFMRVCVETPPLWQIGLSWGLMIASIWLASRMAGKLFRLGILMYGAAPTWGSMLRM